MDPDAKRNVIERYYSNPSAFDYVSFERSNGHTFLPVVVYQRNLDNNVLTAAWPSTLRSKNLSGSVEWYIASDDEDKEVEQQLLNEIEKEIWKNYDLEFDSELFEHLAKMAESYGRPDLARRLSVQATMLQNLIDSRDEGNDDSR